MIGELFHEKKLVMSLEVFPPKKTSPIETVYKTLDGLSLLHPDYISITYSAGGQGNNDATVELCDYVQQKHGIAPLAHLTCLHSTKAQVAAVLDQLKEKGIDSILALRGDASPDNPAKGDFAHACDLIEFIRENGDFDIAGACYPETHPQSESPEADLLYLKHKVDAGVSHLLTQLFFNNDDFYRFYDRCLNLGIDVPIVPGIMPVINAKQIGRMVTLCGATLPAKFARIMARYEDDPEALAEAGISYACDQIIDLIASGVPGIHLYTMNNPAVATRIFGNLQSIVESANR